MVLQSRLDTIEVEGNRYFSSENLKRYIRLKPGDKIDKSRLIQNVSFINRNPFRRVDLVFAPGKEKGTTDLILATQDRRPWRIYSGIDNTGVEPTGECRWYAGFNWGNAFGLDHILSYQFTSSWNMHLFYAHTAEYTAPLSWGHLFHVYGGYSDVHPHVHGGGGLKRNDGWSMQASARYVIPFKIYRYLEHELTIGGDFKRSNNTFEFTDNFPTFGNVVNLTQMMLGYSGNYERNSFRIDFDSEVFYSPGSWIADQSNAAFSSLRPGALNHWVYFRGSLNYLQRLPKSFSISFLAEGQVASNPLLPSEQFGLGGYDSVRGYEQREVNKDDAILLSLETRSPGLPLAKWLKPHSKVKDAIQFLGFIDYGWGINLDTIPGTNKASYLLGAGPGLRYTLEPYLTARLDLGFRLHQKASFPGSSPMIHFSVTASY
ncbi:MAG: ShlB/FhaC/HecB family hemolysin secretion/activation protein [Chlamydiales bacterium]|nr:ShlB/FhaC/HecB family hemolysin secretion/activation protein [Chlamydiales bacterium]